MSDFLKCYHHTEKLYNEGKGSELVSMPQISTLLEKWPLSLADVISFRGVQRLADSAGGPPLVEDDVE